MRLAEAPASSGRASLASPHALLRALRAAIPSRIDDGTAPVLELQRPTVAPPRTLRADFAEHGEVVRQVEGASHVAFSAFLDGVQESRIVTWVAESVPVVMATVGAVILARDGRTLASWENGVRVRRTLIAPRALLDSAAWDALAASAPLSDFVELPTEAHPDALVAAALATVERLRADAERELANEWVARGDGLLWADGSARALGEAARSTHVVGVVKSHRTLYAEGDALRAILGMRVGARSAAFRIANETGRVPVASWYLRLRDATAANPMHGLVRVEICDSNDVPSPSVGATLTDRFTQRVDAVSRAVLAERTPIALPDARWDVMAYGVARCESFLKRGLGLLSRN